jgi:hypothetical protein
MTLRISFLAFVGLGGLLLTFYPTIFSGFAEMQPEAGDVLLNNLFLEHSYRWAFERDYPYSFWSPGFFCPTPYVLTYSETLIGTAPLYWLLRGVGCSETVACQLWIIITFALNYVSMAVVLRWFGVNTLLTAGGAYVFAFGLLRADHLTHQHLMVQYFSPFAVWYAWAFLREPTARRWALLVFLVAIQVLASVHLGWFLCFGLAIFACLGQFVEVGSWRRVGNFVRRRPLATIAPVLAAGMIVAAYARNFYKGVPEPRAYWQAAAYCPYPDRWFVATPGGLWEDHLSPRPYDAVPEAKLFQGLMVFGVFIAAGWHAWRRRFPGRGLVVATLGTAAILFLSVTSWGYNFCPWYFIHSTVPGANAFRAVGRIAFVGYMFGLIGGLFGAQSLLELRILRQRNRNLAFALIAAIMILEQLRPFPEHFNKQQKFLAPVEALKPQLVGVDVAYVVYDGSLPDYRHHIVAMWAGHWMRMPMMNGFSGAAPRGYPSLDDRPSLEWLVEALGPNWCGKLAVIEWGPPVRRHVYQIEPGEAPSLRLRLVD